MNEQDDKIIEQAVEPELNNPLQQMIDQEESEQKPESEKESNIANDILAMLNNSHIPPLDDVWFLAREYIRLQRKLDAAEKEIERLREVIRTLPCEEIAKANNQALGKE